MKYDNPVARRWRDRHWHDHTTTTNRRSLHMEHDHDHHEHDHHDHDAPRGQRGPRRGPGRAGSPWGGRSGTLGR